MTNRYPFYVEWSEEDQEYIATCSAFPGLSAFGKTEELAVREAKIALAGFIETYKTNNMTLPQPSVYEGASGKFQLRLPKSLHGLAVRMAHLEGVSLNSYIADAVRSKVAGEQVGTRVVGEIRKLLGETQTTAATVLTSDKPATKHARKSRTLRAKSTVFVPTTSSRRNNQR